MHESERWKWSRSIVSDSLRPHGLQPTGLLRPWDFPGKSTGVGCHCLLRRSLGSGYQSVAPKQAASVSPGNSLQMQILRPDLKPIESKTLGVGSGHPPGDFDTLQVGKPPVHRWAQHPLDWPSNLQFWPLSIQRNLTWLQSMGLQSIRHDWATEQQQQIHSLNSSSLRPSQEVLEVKSIIIIVLRLNLV